MCGFERSILCCCLLDMQSRQHSVFECSTKIPRARDASHRSLGRIYQSLESMHTNGTIAQGRQATRTKKGEECQHQRRFLLFSLYNVGTARQTRRRLSFEIGPSTIFEAAFVALGRGRPCRGTSSRTRFMMHATPLASCRQFSWAWCIMSQNGVRQ